MAFATHPMEEVNRLVADGGPTCGDQFCHHRHCKLIRQAHPNRPKRSGGGRFSISDRRDIDLAKGLRVGDKVWFKGERHGYTVQGATRNGYRILTKPFNAKQTVIYSVIDCDRGCMGTDNLVFSIGYESDESLAESIDLFEQGEIDISHRNNAEIRIRKIERP